MRHIAQTYVKDMNILGKQSEVCSALKGQSCGRSVRGWGVHGTLKGIERHCCKETFIRNYFFLIFEAIIYDRQYTRLR